MESRVQTVCLVILAAVALGAALYWLGPVMIPFVLAVFIALGLDLVVELQVRRLCMPRGVARLSTTVIAVLFFAAVWWVLSTSVAQLAESAPVYSMQLQALLDRLTEAAPETLRDEVRAQVAALAEVPVSSIGSLLGRTAAAVLNLLSNAFLVLIFALFLILGRGEGRVDGTWATIQGQIQGYLLAKTLISAVTGALVGLVLAVLGVPLAMTFGLLAFLLNFIPSIGSVVATLLPLPVVIVTPEVSPLAAVLAIALPGAIQMVLGNVVEPRLMGRSLDLHPAMILVSLIFWGMLWGVVGMFLATPITAMAKILCERFEGSRPVANLMAGRLGAAAPRGRPA